MNEFELFLITNSPSVATYAEASGVDVIFVDLEIMGKDERQGHTNSLISRHEWSEVPRIREAVKKASLMLRIDPPHKGTAEQIRRALDLGADRIMLPMFTTAQDIDACDKVLQGKKVLVPLVETMQAVIRLHEYAASPSILRLHLGLNDLHLQCGLTFLFEGLTGGLADLFSQGARAAAVPFGIGGVARVGTGSLPAESVLGEHARLGSSAVILSRAFHENARTPEDLELLNFQTEVSKIRQCLAEKLARSHEEQETDRQCTRQIVSELAMQLRHHKP